MKQVEFEVTPNKPLTVKGKARAIFFHRLIDVTLKNDGKIVNVYGDKTPTKVSLVFGVYRTGRFTISGTGSGYIELFEDSDKDVFDPKLHQSILQVD